MSDIERAQGRKLLEEEILRLAQEREVNVDGPVEWHKDFDRELYWLEVSLDGVSRRWKFSYEQLEDSLGDDRVRRELKHAVGLYVVPLQSSGRASESSMQSSPSSVVPSSTRRPLKIFLCHSSGDKPAVRDLYKRLRNDGFAPWLDEEDLIPGQEWSQEIPKVVRGTDVIVVCLSRGSITKEGYVQKEIRIALDAQQEKPDGVIFIVPARLEKGVQVPARLTQWQWVDLFGENGYERLTRALSNRAEQLGLG